MTPYMASIDRSLFKHMVFMGGSDQINPEATPESLTPEQIKGYLLEQVQQKNAPPDLRHSWEAMKGLKFPCSIMDPAALITTYCADVFKSLDAIGYSEFRSENPKYTIKWLLEQIKLSALKLTMEDHVKVETGLEKSVCTFMQYVKTNAAACQKFGQQLGSLDRPTSGSKAIGLQYKPNHGKKV